ncbi:efflux RND transporter periplasmic adaptor subunit [Pararhizobium sp. PWRC1-1]|uniref:efflux RND transporter periplasmic adaptor subunit n=1 Tax=Pararhizobium sp. PWRC1-1 TaxID=2804566 RepID=UPI003CE79EE0
MNTHPDIRTEHDRKLAETLKSLSFEPAPDNTKPQNRPLRRLIFPGCLSALALAAIGGVVLSQAETTHTIQATISTLPNPADSVSSSIEVGAHQDAGNEEQNTPRNPITAVRELTGSGFVVAPRVTTVFSKYEGRITKILVDAGDRVEKNQVLATLEDAGARFALDQAKAGKTGAELVLAGRAIDLAQARASLHRSQTLAARDATSDQALEEARTLADRALNALAQARQDLERADLAIRIAEEPVAELTVRAPFAGTVTRLEAHAGDTVLARIDSVREGQSLMTITDTASMVIDADIAETSIALLQPGLQGEAILDGFPGRPFAVTILRLAPVITAEKGTVALRLSLAAPPSGIRPNMAVRIRIPLIDQTNPIGGNTQ